MIMMHARLNENDAVVELRDLPETPVRHWRQVHDEMGELTGHEEILPADPDHPYDIPHKGVRWRPLVDVRELDDFDPELHDQTEQVRVTEKCVHRVACFTLKSLEERQEKIRARYRDRIVDALPDMKAVAVLAAARDAELANAKK